ncbi:MAG: acylamino acid-releasing protein, partial [Planctomycetaceae bacterium]|nr:acylamino acid-releasing protein [Planctomycetaceae bacterium]
STIKLKQAALHYTTDGDAINKRTWKTTVATIDGSTITAESAPAEATVWFLTVTDERDAVISSRIIIPR